MRREARYGAIISYFSAAMPEAQSELEFGSTFQLLVAVMLSAQCTDRRVNLVTPALFAAYPDAASMSAAPEADLFALIRSVSYPNAKARHLAATARQLVSEHGGEVPDTLEALTALPGVGRKTANVVLAVAFHRPTFAVDTHIFRVARRIGLAPQSATTPLAVERELTRSIPDALIPRAHHWLLLHGRYVCQARRPHCEDCGIREWCRHAERDKKA